MSFVEDKSSPNMRAFRNKTLPRYSNLYFERQSEFRWSTFAFLFYTPIITQWILEVGFGYNAIDRMSKESFLLFLGIIVVLILWLLIGYPIKWNIQKEMGYRFGKDGIHRVGRKGKDTKKVYSYESVREAVAQKRYAYGKTDFVIRCKSFRLRFPYEVGDAYASRHTKACLEALANRAQVDLALNNKLIGYLDQKYYYRMGMVGGSKQQLFSVVMLLLIMKVSNQIGFSQILFGGIMLLIYYIGMYRILHHAKCLHITQKQMEQKFGNQATAIWSDRYALGIAAGVILFFWAILVWYLYKRFGFYFM